MRTQFNEWMSIELNHAGAWLKTLGSSQASDLAPVVPTAISQCVKPSCKDRSEHPSVASKSVEREDLQGLFVTTLEATTLLLLQAHLRGARSYTTKCISSPHATRTLILIMLKGILFHFLLLVITVITIATLQTTTHNIVIAMITLVVRKPARRASVGQNIPEYQIISRSKT